MASSNSQTSMLNLSSIFDDLDLKGSMSKITNATTDVVNGLKGQTLEPVSAVTQNLNKGVALVKNTDSTVTSAISTFTSQTLSGINNAIGALSGGILNLKDFGNVINFDDGVHINQDALMSKVSQQLGFDVNNIGGFGDRMSQQVYNQFNRATNGILGRVTDLNGTTIKMNGNWRNNKGDMTLSILRSLDSNWSKTSDIAVTNSFLNTTMGYVAETGITTGYQSVYNAYPQASDGKKALIDCAGVTMKTGDLDSLNNIMGIVGGQPNITTAMLTVSSDVQVPGESIDGIKSINALFPDLIEQMLSNYKFKEEDYTTGYNDITTLMLDIFTKLKGDKWYQTYIPGFGYVDNLALTKNISPDSLTLLSTVDYLVPMLTTSSLFTEIDSTTLFLSSFPKAPILH